MKTRELSICEKMFEIEFGVANCSRSKEMLHIWQLAWKSRQCLDANICYDKAVDEYDNYTGRGKFVANYCGDMIREIA